MVSIPFIDQNSELPNLMIEQTSRKCHLFILSFVVDFSSEYLARFIELPNCLMLSTQISRKQCGCGTPGAYMLLR